MSNQDKRLIIGKMFGKAAAQPETFSTMITKVEADIKLALPSMNETQKELADYMVNVMRACDETGTVMKETFARSQRQLAALYERFLVELKQVPANKTAKIAVDVGRDTIRRMEIARGILVSFAKSIEELSVRP